MRGHAWKYDRRRHGGSAGLATINEVLPSRDRRHRGKHGRPFRVASGACPFNRCTCPQPVTRRARLLAHRRTGRGTEYLQSDLKGSSHCPDPNRRRSGNPKAPRNGSLRVESCTGDGARHPLTCCVRDTCLRSRCDCRRAADCRLAGWGHPHARKYARVPGRPSV